MRQNNLLIGPTRKPKATMPGEGDYPNLVRGHVIDHPNQVWCGDISYIELGRGFAYIAFLMDAYTRAIRGWEISCRLVKIRLRLRQRIFRNLRHYARSFLIYDGSQPAFPPESNVPGDGQFIREVQIYAHSRADATAQMTD